MAIKLENLLNFDDLKLVFKHFSVTTKLGVALFDEMGRPLVDNRTKGCLCSFATNSEVCNTAIAYGGVKAAELGEPYIFSCGCGLIMCSSPVMFEGKTIGSIVCGPAMLWENDEFAVSELKANIKRLNVKIGETALNFNEGDLAGAVNVKSGGAANVQSAVAVSNVQSAGAVSGVQTANEAVNKFVAYVMENTLQLDCVNINSAAQILFILVGAISRDQSRALKQQAEISRQQAEIGELIAKNKEDKNKDSQGKSNALKFENIEKQLIAAMQLGDSIKAKEMLNRLLGEIFSTLAMDSMRVKVYELTAVLSRAAVDAGAPLEALNSAIKKSAQLLSDDTDFETLCYLTKEILESFIDAVYKYRSKKQTKTHLSRAVEFIKANYHNDLSLETVASNIYVSTYYLSHLFRDDMNTTFLDYVTKIRVNKAKELLKTDISIADIADRVGYSDASYFSKAFKKETGLSPAQFRKIVQTDNTF